MVPYLPVRALAGVLAAAFLTAGGLSAQGATEVSTPPAPSWRDGGAPQNLNDLRALETQLQSMVAKVSASVVNVGGGSGVIVKDNLVLTAGHVIRRPGQEVTLVLSDGRRIKGVTLGLNDETDTGLIRITEEGDYVAAEMGSMDDVQVGHWCFEMGHPGGRRTAGAPLRLGRVLAGADEGWLTSDCTMSGGDSGGPLFDLQGRVIGINSRISANLLENMHVPIGAFHGEWEQLVTSVHTQRERTGRGTRSTPDAEALGLKLAGNKVESVEPDSAMARAGVHAGDLVVEVGGRAVDSRASLDQAIERANGTWRRNGPAVPLVVQRERWRVTLGYSPVPARGRGGRR